MSKILLNEDDKHLLSLIKENKMVEAVLFVKEKTGMGLKQAKEYVDTKRINDNTEHTKNKISSEKIPYKRGYIIDRKINTLNRDLNRQRKAIKVIRYILLVFIIIFLIQLYFLDKTSLELEQMWSLIITIAPIFALLGIWLLFTLNINSTKNRMNKIDELELELSSEFEIKSLKSNWTLVFCIVVGSLLLWVSPTNINTLFEELTYKSVSNVIVLIVLLGFCTYNFFKELKNRKYSLSVSGETVKILYENKEVNSIKTDEINYIEFYSIPKRSIADPPPILRIFDNKKKMLVEMDIAREDYHTLTMYFTNYNVLIQDKYDKI
ncbi:hypothetical protein HW49_10225 [Porphyromonadaceae bacterium COT-184 OH4590]|nr:hypothetical protein HW49_10225 [Porphyromonadaceae bacterium COT-184 OH4590]